MAYFYFGSFEPKSQNKSFWFVSAAVVLLAGFFSLGMSFSSPNNQALKKDKYEVKFNKSLAVFKVVKKKDIKFTLIDKQKLLEQKRKEEEAARLAAQIYVAPIYIPQVRLDSPSLNDLYQRAAAAYGLDWRILAAVHSMESGQSVETYATSSAGATGPMQFLPSTFNTYAIDGDSDGQLNIYDIDDAVFTAAHLLAAANGVLDPRQALYSYNHSWAYVDQVLAIANSF